MPRLKALIHPPRASLAARKAMGRALRERLPRRQHHQFSVKPRREDLLARLKAAVAGRRADLLPIRWRRMAVSPFTFFRGAAAIMAADLGRLPTSGLEVQVCGDAHLLNLAAYAAPDGHLVFDLDDFDETCRGPFEWDLKRLAASFAIAGRDAGYKDKACRAAVRRMVRAYRESLTLFSEMRVMELARFAITAGSAGKPLAPIFEHAARDTPRELLKKATTPDREGFGGFQSRPPLLAPLRDAEARRVLGSLAAYRATLAPGRQQVIDAYAPWDLAFKVAGIGSVGVENYLVLLYGNGPGDPLFLQLKEQDATCWRPYLRRSNAYATLYPHDGRRAAEGQFRTQTVADPFLGWTQMGGKKFLVRQWSDHRATLELGMLTEEALDDYSTLCGQVLAKAHARTGDAARLSGYCGSNDHLDSAIARFALSYADQAEVDHASLRKAIKAGEIRA
jgi:uncharacterized protein (DUF2252 family)